MNIVVAHPKSSFVEATTEMLQGHDSNYKIVGAHTLAELVEKISLDSYDVALIDGDLGQRNSDAFLRILGAVKDESYTIVTLRENDQEFIKSVKKIGVHNTLLKSSGYLLTLTSAIKKATRESSTSSSSFQHVTTTDSNGQRSEFPSVRSESNLSQMRSQSEDEGYFVCDRRGRFLSVNTVLEQVTRYSLQELLQLSIVDLIPENEDGNFLRKVFDTALQEVQNTLSVQLVDKYGERHLCKIQLRVLRDDSQNGTIIGFRGTVRMAEQEPQMLQKYRVDQTKMVSELINLVHVSYSEPLNVYLRRIVEVICQVFKFKRSTLALLDRRKQAFIKHAMVGYTEDEGQSIEQRALEVPREVIDRIFADRFRIKVIYFNQDRREVPHEDNPGVPERRTQRRRPLNEWHKRDLVLLNLKDFKGNTFGYISLDDPQEGIIPTRSTFFNLELFSRLVSMSIENYYRFSTLAKKNRRLKQILANSNIFKLHLSLTELLNEIVWSARYTLDFNLVSLVLISKKTQLLETKAVACDDKIKQVQIRELTYDIHEFSELLKDDYQTGKSYLINREEPVLQHFKQIYYGSESNFRLGDGWPNWALLLVPIKGRDGKIIGFFMADDPADCRIPSPEAIHTLEILANQIAVAIDNRIMYVQAKEQFKTEIENEKDERTLLEMAPEPDFGDKDEDFSKGGFKKLVERFLR